MFTILNVAIIAYYTCLYKRIPAVISFYSIFHEMCTYCIGIVALAIELSDNANDISNCELAIIIILYINFGIVAIIRLIYFFIILKRKCHKQKVKKLN